MDETHPAGPGLEGPRLLVLETSARVGQVAVARGPALLACRRLDEARRHARDLAPAVADLLAGQAWKPRDVDAVFVSGGPGSYTGLRVGIMSAKAFAYATGCPLLAVETFAAIALQAPPNVSELDVIADAQQGKVYHQHFIRSTNFASWQASTALAIDVLTDWLSRRDPSAWLSGPGLEGPARQAAAGCQVLDEAHWQARVESVLQVGLIRFLKGERADLHTVEPLYLRPSSAEEKWNDKKETPRST